MAKLASGLLLVAIRLLWVEVEALTLPSSQGRMSRAALRGAPEGGERPLRHTSHATVWIHAFARSGSSTLLSLVTEAGLEGGGHGRAALRRVVQEPVAQNVENVFALFEPCDNRDQLSEAMASLPPSERCVRLMSNFSRCNFDDVYNFHNWENPHNKRRTAEAGFTQEAAEEACSGADMVAYKTVTRAFEQFRLPVHALPAVDADPNLLLIDVVRDPRSIFASWMSTWPFNDTNLPAGVSRNLSALTGICDSFAASMDVEHPRLQHVVFEHMISEPYETHREISMFLGTPFGDAERQWIERTFNAKECPGVDEYIAPYSDCHTDSNQTIAKWRSVLTEEEQQAFLDHPECVAVAERFNFSL